MTMTSITKLSCIALAAAACSAMGISSPLAQQTYPERSVRVIVPYGPGGETDVSARLVSEKLTESLGQPFVVENRPGGGTVVGTDALAKAEPDGYTLLTFTLAHSINDTLRPDLPYDSLEDFEFISTIGASYFSIVTHPSLPVSSLEELVDYLRNNPSPFASAGVGSPMHLGAELFLQLSGVEAEHVPYQGGAPAIADVRGNHVTFALCSVATCAPLHREGAIKVLATTGATRSPHLPEIPTVAEAGYPGYEVYTWFALAAPKGTPREIVDTLNRATNEALASSDLLERFGEMGVVEMDGSTSESTLELVRSEIEKWAPIVISSGATAD